MTAAPPFVLVHSLGGRAAFWSVVAARLGRNVAVTLRGHGEKAEKAERAEGAEFGLANFAADVVSAADEAGFKRFILVGHSFGALVALDVAARHPSRVMALALVEPAGSMDAVPPAALEEFLENVAGADGMAFVRGAYQANLERASEGTRAQVLESLAGTDQAALVGAYTALFSVNPHELLLRYPGPVRLIVDDANDSPMALHAQRGDLDVSRIAETSHWIPLDAPAALAERLLDTGRNSGGDR